MEEHKRIVEINGVKVEVDLRTAKRVDQFKVGDTVKLLVKEYSDRYEPHVGIIVGFDEFNKLPTLTVAYVKIGYNDVEMKFVGINAKSEDYEIAPLQDYDRKFDYNKCLQTFENQLTSKRREIEDIEAKKNWFISNYDKYFKDVLALKDE